MAEKAAMKYTEEIPSEEGYYWVKYVNSVGNIEEQIVEMKEDGWIEYFGNDEPGCIENILRNKDVRWCRVENPAD